MDDTKLPCTVAILTFNSGKSLKRALESVKDFEDILICDGGSTDDTVEIARAFERQPRHLAAKAVIDDEVELNGGGRGRSRARRR